MPWSEVGTHSEPALQDPGFVGGPPGIQDPQHCQASCAGMSSDLSLVHLVSQFPEGALSARSGWLRDARQRRQPGHPDGLVGEERDDRKLL